MPWARLDDKAITNRKLRKLSHAAFRVWVLGLVHCAQELTNGFIATDVLDLFPLKERELAAAVTELTTAQVEGKAALWHPSGSGYRVNSYLEWNDSHEKVSAERARQKRNKERWRERRGTDSSTDGESRTTPHHTTPLQDRSPSENGPTLTKADKEPSSPVRRLQLRYAELLAKNLKVETVEFNWQKAGSIFKRLIEGADDRPGHGETLVTQALDRFMADHREFNVEARWTIGVFSQGFNRYISDPKPVEKPRAKSAAATGITSDWSEFS